MDKVSGQMKTRRVQTPPLSKSAAVVGAIIAAAMVPACESPTEIVLVIDTNLTKYDVDQVAISITGSMTQTRVVSVAQSPPFPWTLGLLPGSGSGAVEVSVAGSLQGDPVVQQTADTQFVDGQEKMLRILLLDSCVGVSCPSMPSIQTCAAGACESADVAGPSLPSWYGSAPASPMPTATAPIGGRTIWANGWHACANEGNVLYCWDRTPMGRSATEHCEKLTLGNLLRASRARLQSAWGSSRRVPAISQAMLGAGAETSKVSSGSGAPRQMPRRRSRFQE